MPGAAWWCPHPVKRSILWRENVSSSIAGKTLLVSIGALFVAMTGAASAAETQWDKDHPRRDQVNDRLANQNARIKNEVKEGEMSKGQAANLHHDDHQIRQEERAMASQNGGHITKQEQKTLNQQENAVSRKIGQ
jgi:hypothetical protein